MYSLYLAGQRGVKLGESLWPHVPRLAVYRFGVFGGEEGQF